MSAHKLRLNKDVLSGLLFAAFGAGFFWFSRDLEMGTGRRMGPGLFPTILSTALIAIGIVTLLRGWAADSGPIGSIAWRGVGLIVGATGLFALLLHPAGLLPAAVCLVLVGALGSRETRWREILPLALGLAAFSVFIFVYGLGLPLRAIGPLLGG